MVSDSSNSAEGADGTDVDSDADADVAAQPPDELYDEQADDKVREAVECTPASTQLTLLCAGRSLGCGRAPGPAVCCHSQLPVLPGDAVPGLPAVRCHLDLR